MNKQTAKQLARRISQDKAVRVTGTRQYDPDCYALDCVDTTTGIPFMIREPEEWDQRCAEADLYDQAYGKNESITLVEAAKLYGYAYSYLAECARDGRIETRRSGATWLTTRAAIDEAIALGRIGTRKASQASPRLEEQERTMSATFTVGELADAVAGGNERAMRKLLNDAGAHLDEYCQDRGEVVSREFVVDLYAMRAGDRVARKLAVLLQQHASARPTTE